MTEKHNKSGVTYKDAGVDIEAGNTVIERIKPLVAATSRPGSNPDLGGFGGLFDLQAAGFKDPILVAANDGVGTKLKIAIETGVHNTVGIDLVAMCVNDLIVQGAEPLFFLDYFATGILEPDQAVDIIAGIAEGCRQAGCALIGGETAEMPGLYAKGDYDLAGFALGAAERGALLPKDTIAPGDTILALASSGVHSNGFSLVRKLISESGKTYADKLDTFDGKTFGDTFLTPTRIYVKPIIEAHKQALGIKGIAHITGGGLIENIPRVLGNSLVAEIDLSTIALAPVFQWLQSEAKMENEQMALTFNCGVGMVVICAPDDAEAIITHMTKAGEICWAIGSITDGKAGKAEVVLRGTFQR